MWRKIAANFISKDFLFNLSRKISVIEKQKSSIGIFTNLSDSVWETKVRDIVVRILMNSDEHRHTTILCNLVEIHREILFCSSWWISTISRWKFEEKSEPRFRHDERRVRSISNFSFTIDNHHLISNFVWISFFVKIDQRSFGFRNKSKSEAKRIRSKKNFSFRRTFVWIRVVERKLFDTEEWRRSPAKVRWIEANSCRNLCKVELRSTERKNEEKIFVFPWKFSFLSDRSFQIDFRENKTKNRQREAFTSLNVMKTQQPRSKPIKNSFKKIFFRAEKKTKPNLFEFPDQRQLSKPSSYWRDTKLITLIETILS